MLIPRDFIRVGHDIFYQGARRSQAEWEVATKQLLDEGQAFLAYDLAKIGLDQFPDSLKLRQIKARALIQTGALEEARRTLEELCNPISPDPAAISQIYGEAQNALTLIREARDANRPPAETLDALSRALQAIAEAVDQSQRNPASDEETLGLLGRVYKDVWRQSGKREDALLSRDTYLRGFRATGGYYTGINAATMSWLGGDREQARDLARRVLFACEQAQADHNRDDRYWALATMGEAHLLLGNDELALAAYRQAASLAGRNYAYVVSSLQQLKLLTACGLAVPPKLFEILKPPTIVVFTGHMLDHPDRPAPRFPPGLEGEIRQQIEERLDALEAHIGYSSAACGSDILFVEAMKERGAEVNIVLPFDESDFIETSVAFAGPGWVRRFQGALKIADSVKHVTQERFLNDEFLFAFAGQVFQGYAELRARTLGTTSYLLAVWDGNKNNRLGGTSDIVARWPDPDRLRVITAGDAAAPDFPPKSSPAQTHQASPYRRVVKTMLFADVVEYSALRDEYVPDFMRDFLSRVVKDLRALPDQPQFVHTWGDELFAVMDRAMPLVEYAFRFQDALANANMTQLGLPSHLSLRMALHVGPVFDGPDPFTGSPNIYGAHVNRAARIEPVTMPGHIYASEQFVALLTSEEVQAEQEVRRQGRAFQFPFVCDYVGALPLAKDFGPQVIYRIRRRYRAE